MKRRPHPSSLALPRVTSDSQGTSGVVRLLRLRADDMLLSMLQSPPGTSGGGSIEVPSRESVTPGDRVNVEVSFGPMADEVLLSGVVARIHERDGGKAPMVEIPIVRTHAHRTGYVLDVLKGQREATARAHRRVPVTMSGRWFWGMRPRLFQLDELSAGGVFVPSKEFPPAGKRFDVEVSYDRGKPPLRVPAVCIWHSPAGERVGFGVQFKIGDLGSANTLQGLVRSFTPATPGWG